MWKYYWSEWNCGRISIVRTEEWRWKRTWTAIWSVRCIKIHLLASFFYCCAFTFDFMRRFPIHSRFFQEPHFSRCSLQFIAIVLAFAFVWLCAKILVSNISILVRVSRAFLETSNIQQVFLCTYNYLCVFRFRYDSKFVAAPPSKLYKYFANTRLLRDKNIDLAQGFRRQNILAQGCDKILLHVFVVFSLLCNFVLPWLGKVELQFQMLLVLPSKETK